MKSKFFAFLLAAAMTLGLTACGGGDEASSSAPESSAPASSAAVKDAAEEEEETEAEEEEAAEEEAAAEDDLSAIFTLGFAGMGDDGNYYYWASDDDVNFAALVILSEDGAASMNAVGEVTEEEDGYLTIADVGGEYTMTFYAESIDDGVMLTLQDGTEVVLGVVEVAEVIDAITAIDENTEIVDPLAASEEAGITFTDGLYAETDAGAAVMMATTEEGDYSALAMIEADGSVASSFVGPSSLEAAADVDGASVFSVVDETTGESFECYLIPGEDEAGDPFLLLTTDGETGFYLYETDVNEIITAMTELGV